LAPISQRVMLGELQVRLLNLVSLLGRLVNLPDQSRPFVALKRVVNKQ
jgi:hypothetical protein